MGNPCSKCIPTVNSHDDTKNEDKKNELSGSEVKTTNIVFQYHKGICALEYWEPLKLLGEGSISSIHLVRRRKERISVPYKERINIMDVNKNTKISINPGEKLYVLKSIIKEHVQNDIFLEEMRTEIDAMSRLDHPNIANVYEAFERKRHIYLIMEYCSGGDLYDCGPLPCPESRAATIIRSIVRAVAYMHRFGVVHRDLKFENIMFENKRPNAEVKIIDFGLATKYLSNEHRLMKDRVGTVYTMAPQVLQGVYTSQCDMWSVGVITYMLLSGKKPFDGETRKDIVKKILRCEYELTSDSWSGVSDEGKEFVHSLLKMNPKRRLTAEKALRAKWLTMEHDNGTTACTRTNCTNSSITGSMVSFTKESKLKRIALNLIAHHMSLNDALELRDMFIEQDRDGDGKISLEEFKVTMKDTDFTEEEINSIFSAIDVKETGVIDFTEFLASAINCCKTITSESIQEAFDRLDIDHTGFISKKNLRTIMGDKISEELLMNILNEVDENRDGLVSRDEFMALFNEKIIAATPPLVDIENGGGGGGGFDDDGDHDLSERNVLIPGGKEMSNIKPVYIYDETTNSIQKYEK